MRRLFLSLLLLALATDAAARDIGTGQETAVIGEASLPVFTYRPADCPARALLFVFHGVDRNAADYRDYARPLAERQCLIVVAPLFDRQHYPSWRYQRGGIVHRKKVLRRSQWTVTLIGGLVSWARQREGKPDMPFYLFGHSAGAQFLSRVAAFAPPAHAARIVIANASSYVMPNAGEATPYGFAGMSAAGDVDAMLRHYLGLPVTIYLGEADTKRRRLANTAGARRQGANRFERGRTVYEAAVSLARRKGWPCNWKLVTVPRVGHSSRRMLAAPQAVSAFDFPAVGPSR